MEFTYDISNFKEAFESSYTWLNGFARNVARYGERRAMLEPATGRIWTYRELDGMANRLARALQADGMGCGDLLMYQLPNCPEFVYCYIAPQKLAAINCPINYKWAHGVIANTIDDSCPKVFVYDSAYAEQVVRSLAEARHKPARVVVVNSTGLTEPPAGQVFFDDYIAAFSDEPLPLPKTHIYAEATRLYTSGTTSTPKGVPLNNINEVLSSHDVIMHYPLSPMDLTMNMTPWFHRGGLHSGGPTPTLFVGAQLVIMREFQPRACLEYTERYGITFLTGVPAVMTMLLRYQRKVHADLSSLKGIVSMGSPLDRAICEQLQAELTPNIFNGYGTTETFWNTFLRPYDLPDMSGTAGKSCLDDDVRVVNSYEDRHADPDDLAPRDGTTVGEVIIGSPAKSGYCYHNKPEMTAQKFYKGFLYTGDLAVWDENYYITIVGRKDDMIVSAGENIYPTPIEAVLNEHPKVQESCIVGVPDPVRDEAVAAYIVPSDDALTVKELMAYCVSHPLVAAFERPRWYCFVKELPHTATGKLQHYQVKKQAERDQANGLLKNR